MSSELTSAKTHLAALQNEVALLRQREAELSGHLSKATSEAEKYRNDLMRAKDSHTGWFGNEKCSRMVDTDQACTSSNSYQMRVNMPLAWRKILEFGKLF